MTSGLPFFAILAGGFVLGFLARLILPGKERVSWAETVVVGIAGAGLGGLAINLIDGAESPFQLSAATAVAALIGSVLVLAGLVFWRRQRPQLATTESLIAAGESDIVEFKQTARHNIHTNEKDPRLELAVAKTVAGFLNSKGGTLIIGVTDDGTVSGIADDLRHMRQNDLDRYQLWLTDLFERCLGANAIHDISITFENLAGGTVVRIEVAPSDRPVFLDEPGGGRSADFYVRAGNSTRKLLTDEVLGYEKTRWK